MMDWNLRRARQGIGLLAVGAALACLIVFGLSQLVGRKAGAQQRQIQIGPNVRIRIGGPQQQGAESEAGEGVFLPIDRETTRQWEKARQLCDQAHYSDAVVLLDEILKRDEDFFFKPAEDKPTLSSLKWEAQRLIGKMPPEGLQAYQLQFGDRARQMLQAASAAGDTKGLEEIARRFFHTQAGYEATLLLGRRFLDHDQPSAAILCFQRLRDAPQAAAQFEPELSVLIASCWVRAGRPERAADILVALRKKDPNATLRIADKKVKLFSDDHEALAWLSVQLGNLQRGKPEEVENWEVFRGNPARNASGVGSIPLLNPRWRVSTTTHPTLEKSLADLRQQYIDQGIAFLPALHPLAVGNLVLMPTAREVLAVDLESGKRLWPIRGSGDNSLEQLLSLSNGLSGASRIEPQANPWLTERFWWDVTRGTLASDGRQVYLIKDFGNPANLAEVMPNGPIPAGIVIRRRAALMQNDPQLQSNKLCACELRTQGKLKWEVGGATGEEEPKLAGAFFLGPPLPLEDKLYVLAEIKGEIKLCVLDAATGHLDWSQQLAVVERNIQQDPLRRLAGCTPSFADGVLVCPTSAGAVVAVDVANRSLLWGYLYSRSPQSMAQNQMIFRGGMVFGGDIAANPVERWTDSSVTIADGCAVFTPPESGELHCVGLADGKPTWPKPLERGDNLYVACVNDGHVVLVGKKQVTEVNLSDGKTAKTIDLPADSMPSGRGFLSGNDYFLPLTSAEVARIDLNAANITARAKSHRGAIPGNLICYRGEVISEGVDYLESFYQLEPLEKRIAAALVTNPNDAWALAHRGEIALDEGHLHEALNDIRRSYKIDADSFTRDLLIEALTTAMADNFADYRTSVPELEKLVQTDRERAVFYRVLAAGLQKTGDRLAALEAYLKLAALEMPDELEDIDPSLSVSRNRWIRAQFDALLADAPAADRRQIDAAVEKQFKDAASAQETRPLEQFLSFFGDHPLAERAREKLLEQMGDGEPLLEREQLLRRLEQSADPARRKTAMAKSAAMLHANGHDDEAAQYYRRLVAEFGDQPLLGGKTAKQLLAELSADSTQAEPGAAPGFAWPNGEVEIEKGGIKPQRVPNIGPKAMLELRGPREPYFKDTTLELDTQRMELVGRDGLGQERFRQSMNENARMPNVFVNQSPLPYYATTNGHVVVVYIGLQAICIDTLRTANPHSRVLWSQYLTDPSINPYNFPGTMYTPELMPWGGRKTTVRIQNQLVGTVGPCTPNGVILQQGRDVSCLDCVSGKVHWVRHNVTPGSELFGDEEIIIVAPPEGTVGDALVLSAIDGQLLGKRTPPPAEQRWMTFGRNVLTWRSATGGKLQLAANDPWAQRDIWSQSFSPGSKGTIVGGDRVAMLQPDGKFTVIRLADGHKTIDEKLEPETSPSLQGIHVITSAQQDILVTNHAYISNHPQQRSIQIPPPNNESYWILVTGRVYAFDRATGKPQWVAPAAVEQEGLILNPPSELPVLVFLRLIQSSRGQHGSILCLDRRTGRPVYEDDEMPQMIQNYEITGDPQEKAVNIVAMPTQTIKLKFTDAPVPPEPPFQCALFDKVKGTLERGKTGALFDAIRNTVPILDPTNNAEPSR